MSNEAAKLAVTRRETAGGVLVEAVGDLELTTAVILERVVREAIQTTVDAPCRTSLILDLRGVDFIDSAGLALLIKARKRLTSRLCTLEVLLTPGQQPDRVLTLGRFDSIMTLTYP